MTPPARPDKPPRPSALAIAVRVASHAAHRLLHLWRWCWYNVTCFVFYKPLPFSTELMGRIRVLHRPCRLKVGARCRLGDNTFFATSLHSTIELGDEVTVNRGTLLVAVDRITIGSNTAIAEYVSFRDQTHRHGSETGVRGEGFASAPIEIGRNVWIGRGVYIGMGTKIGDNSVVGANSVVHGEFPAGVLIAGAPATIKKRLYDTDASSSPPM